ncbi:hypothetical protein WME94_26795 [Sorangium sp. So ce429]
MKRAGKVRRALRVAQDEARSLVRVASRDAGLGRLLAWLEGPARDGSPGGPEPVAHLVCDDPRLRIGLSFALVRAARRAGFQAIVVPLGPDLFRDSDIIDFLGRRLRADVRSVAVRYRMSGVIEALAARSEARPLLVVIDGLEDSDPRMPWGALASAAHASARVLFASAGARTDRTADLDRWGRRGPVLEAPGAIPGPWPPTRPGGAGASLLALLACSAGALAREEIQAALGRERALDTIDGIGPWVVEQEGHFSVRRALRRATFASVRDAGRRRCDARLAVLPTPYGLAFGALHLERAGAGPRALGALLAPERLERWRREGGAERGYATDAARMRLAAMDRLERGAAPLLGLAVRAALSESTADRLDARRRLRRDARIGDERELALALLALARAARPPASERLARLALRAARRIDLETQRADVLLSLAQQARGADRARLAREALAALASEPAPALDRAAALPLLGSREGIELARALLQEAPPEDAQHIAPFLCSAPPAVARAARDLARGLPEPSRTDVLAAIAAATGEERDVAAALPEARARAVESGIDWALGRLLPHLGRASVEELLSRRDHLSLDLRQMLARRFVSLGGSQETALALARNGDEQLVLRAETLPLVPDAERRAAEIAGRLAALPDPERQEALAIVGTPLARLGQGPALARLATSASAALALARGDRRCARALSPSLAAWALAEPYGWLPRELGPIAGAFAWPDLRRLVGAALEHVASEHRPAALAGDGLSLRNIAPLLSRVAGDAGLVAAGRAAFEVAGAFP